MKPEDRIILESLATLLEEYANRGKNAKKKQFIFSALDISNSQECDAIIAVIKPTPLRLRQLEFVHPWLYTPIAFIIPKPEESQNNIDAVIKPFQFWVCYFGHLKKISFFFLILTFFCKVWMALILAIASVIVTLSLLKRFLKTTSLNITSASINENICIYVIGTLLNQGSTLYEITEQKFSIHQYKNTGGYISNTITPIRLVAGAWCFLLLVLLNVYNGTLISYVMATVHALPLMNSYQDAFDSHILLVVNRGLGPDIVLSVSTSCLKFLILILRSSLIFNRQPKADFTKRWVTNCALILNLGVIPPDNVSSW